jgi:hypothetical protein
LTLILWFLCRYLTITMLEWREREHEEEDSIVGNDLGTVVSLPSGVTNFVIRQIGRCGN